MVDGANEPDGPTNGTGGDDAIDGFTVPAAWIANSINYCRLNGAALLMSGPDQLVYCLEQSTTAQSVGAALFAPSSWRIYTTVTFVPPVTAYSQTAIRRLWKYNMYGVQ